MQYTTINPSKHCRNLWKTLFKASSKNLVIMKLLSPVCEQLQSLFCLTTSQQRVHWPFRGATPCRHSLVHLCQCMVNFGRAEIVTVTLLCNKPACRKPPEAGLDHRIVSALPILVPFIRDGIVSQSTTLIKTEISQQWIATTFCRDIPCSQRMTPIDFGDLLTFP